MNQPSWWCVSVLLLQAALFASVGAANFISPPEHVVVSIDVNLLNVLNFDEIAQEIELDVQLTLSWIDPRLRWNVTAAGYSTRLVDNRTQWMPLLDVEGLNKMVVHKELGRVSGRTGEVRFKRRLHMLLQMPLDFKNFPYDTHHLYIHWQSYWLTTDQMTFRELVTYDDIEANNELLRQYLEHAGLTRIELIDSAEFVVERRGSAAGHTPADAEGVSYATLRYEYVLRRKHLGVFISQMLPVILTVLMGCSALFTFRMDVRFAILGAAIIAVVLLAFELWSELPKKGYLCWMDYFFLLSVVHLVAPLVQTLVEHQLFTSWILNKPAPESARAAKLWHIVNCTNTSQYVIPVSYVCGVTSMMAVGMWMND